LTTLVMCNEKCALTSDSGGASVLGGLRIYKMKEDATIRLLRSMDM